MQMISPIVKTAAVTLQLAASSSPQLCTIACRCSPQVLPLRGSIRPARVCPCHGMPVSEEASEGEHTSVTRQPPVGMLLTISCACPDVVMAAAIAGY